ncbi:MAG TPA: hypothetical protein VFP22_06405 [Candidatus Limnocylindrales bacterium]|nr:hypothetical protein [Candidatus Limnocylindrales bacterium]
MSITIRAVGQASRRGPTRRVPTAAALLDLVESWLAEHAGERVRGQVVTRRQPDGSLDASLHPAARPVRFEAGDAGRLVAIATTVPVGPGYHTFVASLLTRMGDELDVAWAPGDGHAPSSTAPRRPADDGVNDHGGRAGRIGGAVLSRATALPGAVIARASGPDDDVEPSVDPTGAFFTGRRADAERSHLAWLRASLVAVRDARRRGTGGVHLATPPGVRYTFDGAVATVLGPRDDEWLERALGDPRVASDVWPWVADALDARYHLNRALTLMWTQVRWRPPVGVPELEVLDETLASLRFAYALEPALPWPWAEWREAFVLRGQSDPATAQLLQRATTSRARAASGDEADSRIGYRRRPVTIVHEGWALDLPGSFTDERTADEWTGSDAGRTVTLAATATAMGDVPMPAEAFLRQFASGLGRDAIEHEAGPVRGRARLSSDAPTGVEVATVEGYSAVRGSGAVIRIVIEDPDDWKWALDTWRNLRPA